MFIAASLGARRTAENERVLEMVSGDPACIHLRHWRRKAYARSEVLTQTEPAPQPFRRLQSCHIQLKDIVL